MESVSVESIWQKQTKLPECNAARNRKTNHWDVIVVGAGMAGILIAYYLKEQGKQVLVLEADRIASGQTGRTTAKITSQHALKYDRLIKTVGMKKARLYAQANEAAIREFERLIQKEKIACGFERVTAYLYTQKQEALLRQEAKAAGLLGIDAFFTRETELPFLVAGAVGFKEQAQFSPLEFLKQLSAKLEIAEHTKVLAVRGREVLTKDAAFTAEDIVIATHYPVFNLPGFYFLRQHQERSYVLALSGCKRLKNMYYGIDEGGFSFRQAGEFLLLGGGGHRTGDKKAKEAYTSLIDAAKLYYPDSSVETRFSAQDCMPHDGIPFIGRYSVLSPHVYVATGFQKWGMTSSMIAAMLLSEELCGRKSPDQSLFRPQRIYVRAAFLDFRKDVIISAKGLTKGLLHRPKDGVDALPPGAGGLVCIEGKRYACYREENGKLHKISARCPHLGCELAWNPAEKSWDCPCHGSRFDVDGRLLDNPSQRPS